MTRRLLNSITVAILASAQVVLPTPSFAQSNAAVEATRRVNIAGRQRMLSQRISKAVCFLSNQSISMDAQAQVDAAVGLFDTSLAALRRGDPEVGLGSEHSGVIKNALEIVAQDWEVFSQQIQSVQNGAIALADLSAIDATGRQLLENMKTAVGKTASVYGGSLPEVPLILTLTIDLAGRQRMFTQKAAKEFCLIDAGIEVDENRARLAQTTEFFTLTLGALQVGMSGMVMAAPNDEIKAQLIAVADAWVGPRAALEHAASGAAISDAERDAIVNDMEQVLVLMNEAVGMYEAVSPE